MNHFHGKSIQLILFINLLKDDNIIVVHKSDLILSFFITIICLWYHEQQTAFT